HQTPVGVTLDLGELRAWQAGSDPLDVGQRVPGRVDRRVHGEVVGEFHRRRSSRVSMSAGLPAHATSVTSSGRIPMTTRAPASPSTGRSSQTDASSLTGLPLRPSYVATAIAPGAAATARHASASTK